VKPNQTHRWHDAAAEDLIGTPAERAQLFDHLVAATQRRQAISPAKNRLFDINVARDMGRHREALVGARTPAQMWYALWALSNTRHDKHLRVHPVEGGLPVPPEVLATAIHRHDALNAHPAPRAGVELATDFSQDAPFLFLVQAARGVALPEGLEPGARLIGINGLTIDDYLARVAPWFTYSTPAYFWYHLPAHIVRRSSNLPDACYGDRLTLVFRTDQGSERSVDLPYAASSEFLWPPAAPRYAGWHPGPRCQSFDLHRHPDARVIALDWHGFGPTLPEDVDALMAYCGDAGLLDHDIIFDATRCRGGNFGGYLLQRLASRPFRINLGNLRLSDVIEDVIEEILAEDRADIAAGRLNADQYRATGWRRDWLLTDVKQALAANLAETPAVPFKCAHQPSDGDGVLAPAAVHFSGRIACITMPFAGSHIDQVVAQLHDNGLCTQIGMPLGGYSKTWVGSEVLRLPGSGRPLVRFEWSCGNTIRPNGDVLESNPALPHIPLPQTRDNLHRHHALLVDAALDVLSAG